tara:strand:+ start:1754 stop:1960 length:207 start_codon:yes stop_codon:yes gene_type:complete
LKTPSHGVKGAQTGAVTLNQRFGSGLNPNFHFYALFFDGIFSAAFQRRILRLTSAYRPLALLRRPDRS